MQCTSNTTNKCLCAFDNHIHFNYITRTIKLHIQGVLAISGKSKAKYILIDYVFIGHFLLQSREELRN